MGHAEVVHPAPSPADDSSFMAARRVPVPPERPYRETLGANLKETFFPDDPFRQFRGKPLGRRVVLGFQYLFPILDWGSRYTFSDFRADLIAGITIASLAIPQGISYAKLASLPPIIGLYSSFVPPLVYALMGSSKDMAVGTMAVGSLLMASMLQQEVPDSNSPIFIHLAFTATFFAGIFQASLGLLRLGFIVDFLSHATIVGFMGGAATVVCLQQLKSILGLLHFTHGTSVVDVMKSVFTQTHQWRWESVVVGIGFLFFMLLARFISKGRPKMFWISAGAPLLSVILGSILVYLTHAENHGVQVVGHLQKGLNPLSVSQLVFDSKYLPVVLKTGLTVGLIGLAEGIAVGRSFAAFKNYHIDGNKEMIAFGMMNIAGSCTSCYIVAGPFSRSAVNYNAGCRTAVSNIVMAVAVMFTLLFLTPLFYYTPMVVLSSIIVAAMLGLIDYEAAIHLWKIDKVDFCVCLGAYLGVVFCSVEIGLIIAVVISMLRVLLFVARPRTHVLGNIPNLASFRNVNQYPGAIHIPGILILQIAAPIYFANASYLRERISRWIYDEEDRIKQSGEISLRYVILDMSSVAAIDSSGITMLEEVRKSIDRKGLKFALANPSSEVMKKLDKAKFIESLGQEWIYLTVGEAVAACDYMLHTVNPEVVGEANAHDNNMV